MKHSEIMSLVAIAELQGKTLKTVGDFKKFNESISKIIWFIS